MHSTLRSTGVLLIAACLHVSLTGTAFAAKNVVILLADDLGWGDVGFHGGAAETRNIDQLAADGVRLNRFYAYPACSPARAAMLTARFPGRYGIQGPVRPRDEGLPVTERLLVADFKQAGYSTSLIGKWHLGKSSTRGAHPLERGFDQFYGFMGASIDYYTHAGERNGDDWQRDGKQITEAGYSTDLLADEAVRQISQAGKKPFCIVVSFNAPHSPLQAPDELIAKYRKTMNSTAATYAAMVHAMDDGIGRILQAIDQQKLREDTIVVFASDNGAGRGGVNLPFRGKKRDIYEGGIHVPCVVRCPGVIPAGKQSDQLAAIHDLFPTVAAGAGVKISGKQPLDGINLWDNLVSGQSQSRSVVIAETDFTVIQDDWKLNQSRQGVELYNLKTDPTESTNKADAEPGIAKAMSERLKRFQAAVASNKPSDNSVSVVKVSSDENYVSRRPAQSDGEGAALASAKLDGDAIYGPLGDRRVESNGAGIRLLAAVDRDSDKHHAGEASLVSKDVNKDRRWYRYYITGMAQDDFVVDKEDLYLKVEFLQNGGTDSLGAMKTRIYSQVLRERKDLKDDATNESLGHSMWRTYSMDFRTPFAEIDSVKLCVGFDNGKSKGKRSEFWVRSMNLEPIEVPADYQPPQNAAREFPQPNVATLVHLGGYWYFDPQGGSKTLPEKFDHTNAEQLLYKTDRFEAPFAGNMTSWLRAGYKNLAGDIVGKDEYKPDSLVVFVTKEHIVMKSRNLPNHPTATFPDKWRMLDGNPAYIQEQSNSWNIPIEPKVNPAHFSMTPKNENKALPMGPIGVATNGVVFFNPFDHIFETDAVWRLDRCCGHPSPRSQYHYHKYPVCVKTPWSDEGTRHSSIIGFAFDGFPVYGPYEADGLLAKDDKQNPLNDFNLHEDSVRGPHYHVTPGKFPHLIGGYWGEVPERRRRQ